MKNSFLKLLIIFLAFHSLSACHIFYPMKDGLRYDPIEDDPRYKDAIEKIEIQIKNKKICSELKGEMGAIHCFWSAEKKLLKDDYNINWKSPAELNPDVIFE